MPATTPISDTTSLRLKSIFGSLVGAVVMAVTAVFLLAASAPAADYTWSGGTGGTWDTSATNWTSATGTPWDLTNGPLNKAIFSTSGDSSFLGSTVYPFYIQATTNTTIGNGGTAANIIGYAADGQTKTIEAATGTTTTINANITYGGTGANGDILNVRGGGTVTLTGTTMLAADDTNAKTSYFSVEGGSTLNVTGRLNTMIAGSNNKGSASNYYLGGTSASNTINVSGSGKLITGNFNIGTTTYGDNKIYISAPGSATTTTGTLSTVTPSFLLYGNSAQLNVQGSNNLVQVSNGAVMYQTSGGGTGRWLVGNQATDSGNSLVVTDYGSLINKGSSAMEVGGSGSSFENSPNPGAGGGSGNSVQVLAGGTGILGRWYIGAGVTDTVTANNYFLVSGTGSGQPSYLRQNGSTNGHMAIGLTNKATGNYLRVDSGARADIFGTGTGKNFGIGVVAGADNNYILVTGANSTLNAIMQQELTVGGDKSVAGGADNHVDVFDGGFLNMSNNGTNAIPTMPSVSGVTFGAAPTGSGAMVLAGVRAALNIGNNTANTAVVKIGSVNSHSGVELPESTSRVNFNNGQLIADATGNLISGLGQVNMVGAAYISNTDTTTGNIISSLISGAGSLTKQGSGLLTLTNTSNSYLGDTNVLAGTLKITTAGTPWLSDLANVSVASGAKLFLDFTNTDTVNSLFLGGVQVTQTGTYGSTASTATFKDDAYFVGTGILNVSTAAVPEPETLALLGAGLAAAAVLQRRRRRA